MVVSGLRFDGKVAIVTGAGGGLGREYALLLAQRGASVVVNDLGGSRSGEGKSSSAADKVVEEIRAKGGKAVADYNSVEDGEKIVKTALDNFGRIDIVINNAGILRDKSFLKITEQDWDLVHKVHLKGSFMVSRAAWPHFRKQNYGRIIMTSSGAGVYGNFGQSNYGSAKLGLLGLSNTLSIEGAKYGIHCNTVIPLAGSRLTQDIFPPDLFDQLKPAYVAPLVAWLCHNDCPENGGVFEAAGGWVGKYRWQRSIGKAFIPPDTLTPESVRDNWNVVSDMTNAAAPANVQEHTSLLVETMTGGGPTIHTEVTDVRMKSGAYSYEADDAILYALGVGMSTTEKHHLKFLYENSEDFSVLPTFGTIICLPSIMDSTSFQEEMMKVNGDLSKLLHGEQYLELYQPFPSNANLTSQVKVADVLDKGSGAVIVTDVDTFNERGEKVMYNQLSVFLVGSGNFGGKRTSSNIQSVKPPPSRQPDLIIKEKTSVDQAALYRLCGDKNPLHIDPSFAAMGGFPQPILHGLCFLGYATRHVLKNFADYDVKKFKRLKVRFAGPLVPGQTVRTEMWKEGNRIHFQCFAEETGKPIITGGYIDFEGELSMPVSQPKSSLPTESVSSNVKSDAIFSMLAKRLQDMPELASKIQAIYDWQITKDGKIVSQWTLDLKTGQGSLYKGTPKTGKAGCTLILDDDDMVAMTMGKLDAQKAFMSGKLKIKGNIMLTQKLKPLLDNRDKPSFKAAAYENTKSDVLLKSEKVFQLFERKLQKNPDLVTTIQTLYQWNILLNGKEVAQWTLDLKNTPGAVYRSAPKNNSKPDCVFTLEDDLLYDIMYGQADPQRAFMSGKLKITGNVLASQKLQELWEPEQPEADPPMQFAPYKETEESSSSSETPSAVKADFIFQIFSERLIEEPEIAKKMKVVYHWNVLKNGKKVSEWTVDLKTGTGSIYKGAPKSGKADVTLTMDDEDVIKLMLGKLNPQRAFMTGRLKIKGNIMLTQKLNQLWQEILKSGRAVELPLLAPILSDKPLDPNLKSEVYFVELAKRISRKPEWISKLQTIYEWNITSNGKPMTQWILNMKTDKGSITRGPSKKEKASCSFTLEDEDFADLVLGRLAAQQAVSNGKIKVAGDNSAAQKLLEIFKPQSKL